METRSIIADLPQDPKMRFAPIFITLAAVVSAAPVNDADDTKMRLHKYDDVDTTTVSVIMVTGATVTIPSVPTVDIPSITLTIDGITVSPRETGAA
jgi:hypothetical protein